MLDFLIKIYFVIQKKVIYFLKFVIWTKYDKNING